MNRQQMNSIPREDSIQMCGARVIIKRPAVWGEKVSVDLEAGHTSHRPGVWAANGDHELTPVQGPVDGRCGDFGTFQQPTILF